MWQKQATAVWRLQAACRDADTAMFFQENATYLRIEAKRLCATCAVRRECLEFGLREPYGMWGGLGPSERAACRSKHGIPEPDPFPEVTRAELLLLLDDLGYVGPKARTKRDLAAIYGELLAAS